MCPGCGAANARAMSSGLGGRWKVLCRACGYRYDESDGDRLLVDPATVIEEEKE